MYIVYLSNIPVRALRNAFSVIREDNKSSKGLIKTIKYLFGFKHYHSCVTEGFNATLLRKDNGANRRSRGVVMIRAVYHIYIANTIAKQPNSITGHPPKRILLSLHISLPEFFFIVFLLRGEGCKMTSDALIVFVFTASLFPYFVA